MFSNSKNMVTLCLGLLYFGNSLRSIKTGLGWFFQAVKMVFSMRSIIRVFSKFLLDPYYEPLLLFVIYIYIYIYIYVCIYIIIIYYIKLKSRLSVCLSAVSPVTQLCLHVLTWDLHYAIAMSSSICKFLSKSF